MAHAEPTRLSRYRQAQSQASTWSILGPSRPFSRRVVTLIVKRWMDSRRGVECQMS